ncbi:MAG TPA: GGDEF domain-containing protein [Patescibacteria group bacterium]|nr:GGDEF domain-containing protein [Patescibacteria group bacterium]
MVSPRFDPNQLPGQPQFIHDEAHYADILAHMPDITAFQEHVDEAMRAAGPDRRVGVLVLDLDRFKLINDVIGHPMGDIVLGWVSGVLSAPDRPYVARTGGDEFAICVTFDQAAEREVEPFEGEERREYAASASEQAAGLAERLRDETEVAVNGQLRGQIQAHPNPAVQRLIADFDTLDIPIVGVSAGFAVAQPGESLANVLGNADSSLRTEKQASKVAELEQRGPDARAMYASAIALMQSIGFDPNRAADYRPNLTPAERAAAYRKAAAALTAMAVELDAEVANTDPEPQA